MAQVRARQRLALWQGLVDTRAVEVTAAQHGGEQTHLAAGAPAFAFDACGRQGGFAADQFDEVIAQGVQLIGHRIQKLRTPCGAQGTIGRVRLGRGPGGGVHFLGGGLVEILGQGFAGGSVDALQLDAAVGAALAADVVVAEERGHVDLLKGG